MSSAKTETLKLNTWAPTDYVNMGEFNDNFQKIDEAHKEVATQLADTAKDIEERGVSVKKFGAKGDGVTDDTTAIQNTIDYAISKKLSVYVPPGEYKTTETLVINTSGVKIVGKEIGLTVFSFYGESKPFMTISNVYGYYLDSFTVENKSTTGVNVGIVIDEGVMGYMKNIHMRYFDTHIDVVQSSWINRFSNVYFSYGNYGIKFGLNTNQTVLDKCAIRHMDSSAIWVAQCNGLTISNTDMETCRVGVLVKKNDKYPRAEVYSLTIDKCYTEGNLDGFLRVEGSAVKGKINLLNNFITMGAYRGDTTQITPYAVNVLGLTGTDVIDIASDGNSFRYNHQSTAIFNGDGLTRIMSNDDWSEAAIPFHNGVGSFVRTRNGYGEMDIEVKNGSKNGNIRLNGYLVGAQGEWAYRPTSPIQGQMYFATDSSLKKPFWYRGSSWFDASGVEKV